LGQFISWTNPTVRAVMPVSNITNSINIIASLIKPLGLLLDLTRFRLSESNKIKPPKRTKNSLVIVVPFPVLIIRLENGTLILVRYESSSTSIYTTINNMSRVNNAKKVIVQKPDLFKSGFRMKIFQ